MNDGGHDDHVYSKNKRGTPEQKKSIAPEINCTRVAVTSLVGFYENLSLTIIIFFVKYLNNCYRQNYRWLSRSGLECIFANLLRRQTPKFGIGRRYCHQWYDSLISYIVGLSLVQPPSECFWENNPFALVRPPGKCYRKYGPALRRRPTASLPFRLLLVVVYMGWSDVTIPWPFCWFNTI